MAQPKVSFDNRGNDFNIVDHRDIVRGPLTRVSVVTPVGDVSMTVQSETDSCDINSILRRYQNTGVLDHVNSFDGRYDDYSDFPDTYQEAMNIVLDAQASFAELPSHIRDAFANDPHTFFKAVHDPAQQDRLIQLGVLTKREEPPKDVADAPKASATASTTKEAPTAS